MRRVPYIKQNNFDEKPNNMNYFDDRTCVKFDQNLLLGNLKTDRKTRGISIEEPLRKSKENRLVSRLTTNFKRGLFINITSYSSI